VNKLQEKRFQQYLASNGPLVYIITFWKIPIWPPN